MRCRLNLPSKLAPTGDLVWRSRRAVPTAIATASLTACLLWYAAQTRFIVLNVSPSVPLGLYVKIDDRPSAGHLVEFQLPPHVMGDGRHARHRVILKPIAAGPGDHIDTTGDWLFINERCIAPIFTVDSEGQPLPVWRARRVLQPGEFFVFSARVPNSFDSRYFGPIRCEDIIAVRRPLWTWNSDVDAITGPSGSSQAGSGRDPVHLMKWVLLMNWMCEFRNAR